MPNGSSIATSMRSSSSLSYRALAGKSPEANADHIRELIVQSQRVIYAIDVDQDTINILALVHVRQDFQGQDNPP
jgi:plasmid stabilization system protein ParE